MGFDGSHLWTTVQNSFRVVNTTKNKLTTTAFIRIVVTKFIFPPVIYRCTLITTGKTMQFKERVFLGKIFMEQMLALQVEF